MRNRRIIKNRKIVFHGTYCKSKPLLLIARPSNLSYNFLAMTRAFVQKSRDSARSSRGLGHQILILKIRGSNPLRATRKNRTMNKRKPRNIEAFFFVLHSLFAIQISTSPAAWNRRLWGQTSRRALPLALHRRRWKTVFPFRARSITFNMFPFVK